MHRALREVAFGISGACRKASQQLEALVDRVDRPDVEALGTDGIDDLLAQHQVARVGARDDDALLTGQPGRLPMEDMEYTTMPAVAERIAERWEPIEEPTPVPA
jgi:hypothetical protein